MKRFGLLAVLTNFMVFASLSEGRQPQGSQQTVLRGWLSDEGCAGRPRSLRSLHWHKR